MARKHKAVRHDITNKGMSLDHDRPMKIFPSSHQLSVKEIIYLANRQVDRSLQTPVCGVRTINLKKFTFIVIMKGKALLGTEF